MSLEVEEEPRRVVSRVEITDVVTHEEAGTANRRKQRAADFILC